MTAGLNAAATAGKDGTGSLPDRFRIQQHGFHTAKSRLNWSLQTRSWVLVSIQLFHSPWGGSQASLRVCGEGFAGAIFPYRPIFSTFPLSSLGLDSPRGE
jgi:hypothetical protein